MTIAAFFDFDGTIIEGYSAKAVLSHRIKHADLGLRESLGMLAAVARTVAGQDALEDFMRVGVAGLKGREVAELEKLGRELTRSEIGGWLFPEAAATIADHKAKGHLVVIASSALPFQVNELARELGIDHVVCTRLAEEDGVLTGEIDGDIVWDKAKARAVKAFARANKIDLAASYAYGNGDEDIAFLSTVGHPVAVNPGSELAEAAAENGWPVKSFAATPGGGVVAAVRTVAAYAGLAAGCTVGAGLGLINHSRREAANIAFAVGSDVGLSLAGIKVNVAGEKNLWEQRPAVFIFNHQSLLDGWAAINLVRSDFTGVGKKEMSKVPVMAQFAWLTNVALIDRADSGKARAALEPVLERLQAGYSITLAPEGGPAP